MNAKEIINLVETMRDAQRHYFQTRTPEALRQAQQLERDVDRAIANYHDTAQRRLFT